MSDDSKPDISGFLLIVATKCARPQILEDGGMLLRQALAAVVVAPPGRVNTVIAADSHSMYLGLPGTQIPAHPCLLSEAIQTSL